MLVNNFVKQVDAHDLDFLPTKEKVVTRFVISTIAKL
jgi:hypothetical protein